MGYLSSPRCWWSPAVGSGTCSAGVRIYNLGFLVFSIAAVLLSVDPFHGQAGALWLYLLPLTAGFLAAGPLSGRLSDRHGARLLATGGLLLVAATFLGLLLLPVDFPYWAFATLVALNGIGSGLFSAPNTSGSRWPSLAELPAPVMYPTAPGRPLA